MDGNISREGITADLEAIQRVGIGGALLMDVSQEIPPGTVRFGTSQWRDLFKHTVTEARRLGLELSMNNAPGWCGSGGPWVTPELAMQKLVWNSTNLAGPIRFDGLLPRLQVVQGFSRDIATIAFPTLVGDGVRLPDFAPKITASPSAGFDGARLVDGDLATSTTLPISERSQPRFIQLEFAQSFAASQLKLAGAHRSQSFEGELQVSNDGKKFTPVRPFHARDGGALLQFESRSARFFRLLFKLSTTNLLEFSELELMPVYRIASHQAKAGLGPWSSSNAALPQVPAYACIRPDMIVDLSTNVNQEDRLTWNVPNGLWTVVRFGYTPTGMPNHPIGLEGSGLECDKLSREAIESHFDSFLAKLSSDVGGEPGNGFVGTHIDSWEIGYQNWTARFREEFRQRRGYDLLPYLPTFTGRYVDSPEVSERFLGDVRRTIADLLADNYAGGLAQLAHKHRLKLSIEAYANGPFNSLQYAGRADLPMSEFWNERDDFSRFYRSWVMSSAAHTYGRPIVPAEAFTSYPVCAKWQNHPFSLKAMGDAAFCEGVNRLVFHRYAHQPWLDRKPGMTMGPWGVHYERTQTWWEQSKPWHEYLSRCQFLLQQGLFAADMCYITDEGAFVDPPTRDKLQPELPPGYACDITTPEVALTRMSVRDGRVILPDGMSYRLLVLPPSTSMSRDVLAKIKAMVEAGATVVGAKPSASTGLVGYPRSDEEVRKLAAELWGNCDGHAIREHKLGKGKVICSTPLGSILKEMSLPPDFEQLTPIAGQPLRWIHRAVGEVDFYFVANSNPQPASVECAFRVAGKTPELWHPESGAIESAPIWQAAGATTRVRLALEPCGSVFVVFAKLASGADPVVSFTRNGKEENGLRITAPGALELSPSKAGRYDAVTASGKRYRADIQDLPKPISIAGPWDVQFPPDSGAPPHMTLNRLISWSEHNDPGVKYFSGTTTYSKTIQVPPAWMATNQTVLLDLGRVQVIAELRINGQDGGILWKPPFEADITSLVHAGDNQLQIKVVNLWPNRLIGDEQLPDDCQWAPDGGNGQPLVQWPEWLSQGKASPTGRKAFATWKHWHKNDALLESGLLGPVTLRAISRIRLRSGG